MQVEFFKSVIKAGAVSATLAFATSTAFAAPVTVIHNGEIFHDGSTSPLGFNVPGYDGSVIHKSSGGGGGSVVTRVGVGPGDARLSTKNNVPISYSWTVDDVTGFGTGSTAVFDQSESVLFSDNDFRITLKADGSTLTATGGVGGVGSGVFNLTGSLGIQIEDLNNQAVLNDVVAFNMVNGNFINTVRTTDDVNFNFILWGDTGAFGSNTSQGTGLGDVTAILAEFYNQNKQGLGLDLLFNGTPSAVPVPAALPLLGMALTGLFLAGRRKKRKAAA